MTPRHITRVTRLAAAVLGFAALVLVPAASHAGPPERWSVEVDDSFVSQRLSTLCGFGVVTHIEGKVRGMNYVDRDGTFARSLVVYPSLTYTFANAETGETISSRSPDPEHFSYAADGSFTLKVTGLVMHFQIPGEGVIGQAGQFTVTVDAEGDESGTGPVGLNEDYHEAICEQLAR